MKIKVCGPLFSPPLVEEKGEEETRRKGRGPALGRLIYSERGLSD